VKAWPLRVSPEKVEVNKAIYFAGVGQ
jgi:hypothetical protein